MADRSLIYSGQIGRDYDLSHAWRDQLKGMARLIQDILHNTFPVAGTALGNPPTVISGLALTTTGGLNITVGDGYIYSFAPLDSAGTPGQYGSLVNATDIAEGNASIYQQGYHASEVIALAAPGGGSNFYTVQATFTQTDQVRSGDASAGILPFYNSANPTTPLVGPGGSGSTLNTVRLGKCVLSLKLSTSAYPSPDAGNVAVWNVKVDNGQATILFDAAHAQIPSNAPFIQGSISSILTGALPAPYKGSHHRGGSGSAAKIDGSIEWAPQGPVYNDSIGLGAGTAQQLKALAAGTLGTDAVNMDQFLSAITGVTAGGFRFPRSDGNPLVFQWKQDLQAAGALAAHTVTAKSGVWPVAYAAGQLYATFGICHDNVGCTVGIVDAGTDNVNYQYTLLNGWTAGATVVSVQLFAIGRI